jgi:hypothetical protein
MKLSQLVQSNQTFNSNTYKNLSPVMKEAVNDVFKLVEKSQDDILKRFDKSVEKVCEFHNVNKDDIEEYFDNEVNEQLGEK